VSLFILSLGIIGAASMQLTALRTSQQSGFHHVALQLAMDTADQIRAVAASNVSDISNPLLTLDFQSSGNFAVPAVLCHGTTSNCDGQALAAFAIYETQSRMKMMLPQGRIKVCRDDMPWDDSVNSYTWDCSASGSATPLVVKLGWREPQDGMAAGARLSATPQLVLVVRS